MTVHRMVDHGRSTACGMLSAAVLAVRFADALRAFLGRHPEHRACRRCWRGA